MADKKVEIALVLSAYDKISSVVNAVVSKTTSKLASMQAYSQKLSTMADKSKTFGRDGLTAGATMAAPLVAAAKAYADQEEALLRMKATMMRDGNVINQKAFNDLAKFAMNTSDQLTGSTADYLNMIRVLQENSIKSEDILNGIGGSVAKLSVLFHMAPDSIAQFAARMRQDMSVLPKEMDGMMDFIARLQAAGVGKNGEEAVNEMGEAFSKAGLGAQNLGVKGLQASKDLGALMGIFIRRGLSGQTVGNNFRRIFDGLRDGEKLQKANEVARQYGITLDLFDKNHKFRGVPYLVGELNKLKGMDINAVSAILKPFGGKQGLSTDFLEFLGKEGTEAFNGLNERLSQQALYGSKVKTIMSGLSNQFNRTKTNAINLAATFASTYAPQIKSLLNSLNSFIARLSVFINTHRTLVGNIAKAVALIAGYRIATGGAALAFGFLLKGVVNMIQMGGILGKVLFFTGRSLFMVGSFIGRMGLLLLTRGIPAMVSFTATVWANAAAWLANPATWIIIGIIAAIAALVAIGYVVYKNWDKILKWFSNQWILMKAQVAGIIGVFRLFGDVLIGVGKAFAGAFTFNPKLMIQGAKEAATAVSKIAHGGIGKAYTDSFNATIKTNGLVKIGSGGPTSKPIAKTSSNQPVQVTNHYQVNLNGIKTDDPKAHADQFAKWLKQHQRDQLRTSYK